MPLSAKYGIIADIHANYTALKVALDYLQMAGVDKILCLGDIVGYGAEPFKCIQALKDKSNIYTIMGNHDRTVIGEIDPKLRKTAAKVLKWTADNISPAEAFYLKSLPEGMTIENTFMMVHGSIVERDAYILNTQEISKNLSCMINDFPTIKVCFFGHTHIPMLINTKQVITDLRETKTFQLDPKDVYLINPGSVGQPRDKCPLAAFGIFNAENWQMQFIRKPYDYRLAQKLIIDSGLPEKFSRGGSKKSDDGPDPDAEDDALGSRVPRPRKPLPGPGYVPPPADDDE